MACFLVPVAEAIVVTMIKKNVKKKEAEKVELNTHDVIPHDQSNSGISWSRRLSWLTNLLWGGVYLLAIEHIWHGEVILYPPFLTAMKNPADILPILHEIATVGVSMAVFVTIIWGAMVFAAEHIYRRSSTLKYITQED